MFRRMNQITNASLSRFVTVLMVASWVASVARLVSGEPAQEIDSRATLWNPDLKFPAANEIPLLKDVEYRLVHEQIDDYRFLHEPRIASFGNQLFVTFSNAPRIESEPAQIMRYRSSADGGKTWSDVAALAEKIPGDNERRETACLLAHEGRLWAFVGRYAKGSRSSLGMEIFRLNEQSEQNCFEQLTSQLALPGFVPFVLPQRLENGNWIVGGHCDQVRQAAVAISKGNDLTQWRLIKIDTPSKPDYPETALLVSGKDVWAVARNRSDGPALLAVSNDFGESFTSALPTNLPMACSKPFAGTLSTGQKFLIFNAAGSPPRNVLLIAISKPGDMQLSKVWKIIDGSWGTKIRPLLNQVGDNQSTQEWAYPEAVEAEGKLQVVFSQSKRNCFIATIPLAELVNP